MDFIPKSVDGRRGRAFTLDTPDGMCLDSGCVVGTMSVLLRAQNLTAPFDLFKNVDVTLTSGSFWGVLGANGTGKSTFLKILAELILPLEGRVQRFSPLSYLPQVFEFDRRFPLTVYEVVAMGVFPRVGWLGALSLEDRRRVDNVLDDVGAFDLRKRSLSELSGGEFQRVLLARLLLQEAMICLLDEPFSAIDQGSWPFLITLLETITKRGGCVVCALHPPDWVHKHLTHTLRFPPSFEV